MENFTQNSVEQRVPAGQLSPSVAAPRTVGGRRRPFQPDVDHNFSLLSALPGNPGALAFRPRSRYSAMAQDPEFLLGPNDVEIELRAASLNFRDVAIAMGMYPPGPGGSQPHLGCDGAGVVSQVGHRVTRCKTGDEVVCLSAKSTFARYTCTNQSQVFPKPQNMTFEQAASLPLVFVTAYQGLVVVGRIAAGDLVLVHSAAGGVGQAAVQILQLFGAEMIVTAGTPEKRGFLESLGIRHVLDSRKLAFVPGVQNATRGEGVDLILNSLPGAITAGMHLLRPGGRFVELGKRDLMPGRTLDLECFRKGLTFAAVDVAQLAVSRKGLGDVIDTLAGWFADGRLTTPPIRVFRATEIVAAFCALAEGKHIGKFVISLDPESIMLEGA